MKPIALAGKVTKFRGNGRELGYPTANITTETDLEEGVYFGFADLATFASSPALIFIGIPTTMGDSDRRVEVHVLDIPDVDYYDQTLNVQIDYFHRPNQRFDSVKELLSAMHDDETQARRWFSEKA
jgi:FAD synthase